MTDAATAAKTVSIVVNNYNYARFLRAAIDSALAQTYPRTEIVVVDDGSSDDSRNVIAEYADRVVAVMKDNGGQASAFHAGLRASHGDVIVFLDADDVLLPHALERAVKPFEDPVVAKVHWPLRIIDAEGRPTDEMLPPARDVLPEGDLRATLVAHGPDSYLSSPSSGNAWSRSFLEQVLPAVIESDYRRGADGYLITLAPLFGTIRAVHEPLSLYRSHGNNQFWSGGMDRRIRGSLSRFEARQRTLVHFFQMRNMHADVAAWRAHNTYYQWMCRLDQMLTELAGLTELEQVTIFADEDQCGGANALTGRRLLPFPERDGQYWGAPEDSAVAIRELERLRAGGASKIAFAWPAFWWLDHYAAFSQHVRSRYRCISGNDRLVVFDLTRPPLTHVRETAPSANVEDS
jgi:glycosyltransferase involved in cell wall biosynthesis